MKLLDKKGQVVNGLQSFIFGIVAIAVILAIGLYVLQEMRDATTLDGGASGYDNQTTMASNATGDIIDKIAVAPTWIGILIIVVFATAILSYFYMSR